MRSPLVRLLFVVAVGLTGRASRACLCPPPPPPQQSLAIAAAVFEGTILSVAPAGDYLRARLKVMRRWKAPDVPELIVTHGARGATVNGVHVKAEPVDGDPTGAGDMFGAAYLVARSEGADPVAAAQRATALVSELLR